MGMLDTLIQEAGGAIDLNQIGARFGLSPEQVQSAANQLLPHIADPNVDNQAATANVAQSTGIDAGTLTALIPALTQAATSGGATGQQGGVLNSVLAGLGGAAERQGGILGTVSGLLDRDGDGNPLNDVMGMFKRT